MEPKEFDFEFPRGDTCPLEFELIDDNGSKIESKKDFEVYFTLKNNFNQSEFIFQKKYSNKEIEYKNGMFFLIINHNDTANLKIGKYVYDVQLKSGDYVKTLILGEITLTKEVTWISNE